MAPTEISACNKRNQRNKRQKRKRLILTSTFHDIYELSDEILGKGAYASVVVCVNLNTKQEYAVKIIDKESLCHTRSRVFREIETFHHCQEHPNIIELIEYFEDDQKFYLVFEKINGGQLLRRIEENGNFTEAAAAEIVREIASALQFMHGKGIAHRDLKPENILCVNEDSLYPIKICDFDLASGVQFESYLSEPMVTPQLLTPVGTVDFMAPEIVEGFIDGCDSEAYDKRCDLWSLGVIIYILLCGYPPFYGRCSWECDDSCGNCDISLFYSILEGRYSFPEAEWANISKEAKDLISSLLVKNASERISAENVLKHPWLKCASETTKLSTPMVIKKNDSSMILSQMTKSAMAVLRAVDSRFCTNVKDLERLRPNLFDRTRFANSEKGFNLNSPSASNLLKKRLQELSNQRLELIPNFRHS